MKTENLRYKGASGGMQWMKSGCGVGKGEGKGGSWFSSSATSSSMLTVELEVGAGVGCCLPGTVGATDPVPLQVGHLVSMRGFSAGLVVVVVVEDDAVLLGALSAALGIGSLSRASSFEHMAAMVYLLDNFSSSNCVLSGATVPLALGNVVDRGRVWKSDDGEKKLVARQASPAAVMWLVGRWLEMTNDMGLSRSWY